MKQKISQSIKPGRANRIMGQQFIIERIPTGVRNLDAILNGGLPNGTVTLVAGAPGAGKTTLAQQIAFHNASPDKKALFFSNAV